MRVRILGCGAAGGVPTLDSGWGACDPTEPRNARTRSSILIETAGVVLLIDAGPDLRAQLLREKVNRFGGVLFTHAHADHIHGIDDLRAVNRTIGGPLPIWVDGATLAALEQRFGYALAGMPEEGASIFRPWLIAHVVRYGQTFEACGVQVMAFQQDHGYSETLGFRIGDFAYSTDVRSLPEESFAALSGVKVWLIGAFQMGPHPTHAGVNQVLEWVARVKPQRSILTHLSHKLDYQKLKASLPEGVSPAYDGMSFTVDDKK